MRVPSHPPELAAASPAAAATVAPCATPAAAATITPCATPAAAATITPCATPAAAATPPCSSAVATQPPRHGACAEAIGDAVTSAEDTASGYVRLPVPQTADAPPLLKADAAGASSVTPPTAVPGGEICMGARAHAQISYSSTHHATVSLASFPGNLNKNNPNFKLFQRINHF
jgi:hypothetical protein